MLRVCFLGNTKSLMTISQATLLFQSLLSIHSSRGNYFFYHEKFIHVCIYQNNREMLQGLKRHSIIHNVGIFFSQKLTHEARFTNPTSHTQLLC